MRGTLGQVNLGIVAAITLTATGCLTLRPYDPGPGKRVAGCITALARRGATDQKP